MNQLLVYLLVGVCAGARISNSPEGNSVTDNPGRDCLPWDGSVVPDCTGKSHRIVNGYQYIIQTILGI